MHGQDNRQFALHQAITYYTAITSPGPQYGQGQVTHAADVAHIADVFYRWLTAVTRLQVESPRSLTRSAATAATEPQPSTREGNPHGNPLTDRQRLHPLRRRIRRQRRARHRGHPAWVSDDGGRRCPRPPRTPTVRSWSPGRPVSRTLTVADAGEHGLGPARSFSLSCPALRHRWSCLRAPRKSRPAPRLSNRSRAAAGTRTWARPARTAA